MVLMSQTIFQGHFVTIFDVKKFSEETSANENLCSNGLPFVLS